MSGFIAFTGHIYITGFVAAKDVEIRLRLAGINIGNPIALAPILNQNLFNVWQTFTINISEFNVAGDFDQVIIQQTATGGGPAPNYWLDKLDFQESGGTIDFIYQPQIDEIFHIKKISTTFVDNYTGLLEHDKILSLSTLANGNSIRIITGGEILAGLPLRNLYEYMDFPQSYPL